MPGMDEDEVVVRRDVSWAAFEKFLAAKGDDSVPRIAYLDGVLELMTPSKGHEKHRSWVSRLVETYAIVRGVELSAFGSWLLKDELKRAGAEPDECYVLGPDDDTIERPNFVIEVQWSRPATNKLEIYKRLGVPEVWFWKKPNAIAVHVLRRGRWRVFERSPSLPDLDLELMCSFLGRRSMTQAMRDFAAALR
jgi:Uma2 family endonuclease